MKEFFCLLRIAFHALAYSLSPSRRRAAEERAAAGGKKGLPPLLEYLCEKVPQSKTLAKARAARGDKKTPDTIYPMW